MYSLNVPWFFTMGVSPFGNLRLIAYLQLTVAYRSLSRPSSAPDAKAFTLCSYSLELPSRNVSLIPANSRSLNCLSFFRTNYLGFHIRFEKVFLFVASFSTFRWNCIYPSLERPNFFLTIANLLKILSSKSVRFYSSIFLLYSVFNEHCGSLNFF